MKPKHQYFITVDTNYDRVIWGCGKTKAASLKDARYWVKENGDKGTLLSTHATDKRSYDLVKNNKAASFPSHKIVNDFLVFEHFLKEDEEQEEQKRQADLVRDMDEYDLSLSDFKSLSNENKLLVIFIQLKSIEKRQRKDEQKEDET